MENKVKLLIEVIRNIRGRLVAGTIATYKKEDKTLDFEEVSFEKLRNMDDVANVSWEKENWTTIGFNKEDLPITILPNIFTGQKIYYICDSTIEDITIIDIMECNLKTLVRATLTEEILQKIINSSALDMPVTQGEEENGMLLLPLNIEEDEEEIIVEESEVVTLEDDTKCIEDILNIYYLTNETKSYGYKGITIQAFKGYYPELQKYTTEQIAETLNKLGIVNYEIEEQTIIDLPIIYDIEDYTAEEREVRLILGKMKLLESNGLAVYKDITTSSFVQKHPSLMKIGTKNVSSILDKLGYVAKGRDTSGHTIRHLVYALPSNKVILNGKEIVEGVIKKLQLLKKEGKAEYVDMRVVTFKAQNPELHDMSSLQLNTILDLLGYPIMYKPEDNQVYRRLLRVRKSTAIEICGEVLQKILADMSELHRQGEVEYKYIQIADFKAMHEELAPYTLATLIKALIKLGYRVERYVKKAGAILPVYMEYGEEDIIGDVIDDILEDVETENLTASELMERRYKISQEYLEYKGEKLISYKATPEGLVIVKEGTKKIDKHALAGCKGITEIQLASTVQVVGQAAFKNCTGLLKVMLPPKLKSLQSFCFADCTKLVHIAIPDEVTNIPPKAFKGCLNLRTVVFPRGLQVIRKGSFAECYNLKQVTIPQATQVEAGAFPGSCRIYRVDT